MTEAQLHASILATATKVAAELTREWRNNSTADREQIAEAAVDIAWQIHAKTAERLRAPVPTT